MKRDRSRTRVIASLISCLIPRYCACKSTNGTVVGGSAKRISELLPDAAAAERGLGRLKHDNHVDPVGSPGGGWRMGQACRHKFARHVPQRLDGFYLRRLNAVVIDHQLALRNDRSLVEQ